jgi:uncharacterized membrane protein
VKHRMAIATMALIGFFIALYLSLWKLGFMGMLACGTGSCELVQTSEQAYFLKLPVAFYGVGGYLALFVVGLVGLQPKFVHRQSITTILATLAGVGFVFTAYLTYVEAFVLGAWCRWCLVSAAIITLVFACALAGFWELRHPRDRRQSPDA